MARASPAGRTGPVRELVRPGGRRPSTYGRCRSARMSYPVLMVTTLPYGSWPSPISAELLATGGTRLGTPQLVGDAVWWTEGIATEGGRLAIVRSAGPVALPCPRRAMPPPRRTSIGRSRDRAACAVQRTVPGARVRRRRAGRRVPGADDSADGRRRGATPGRLRELRGPARPLPSARGSSRDRSHPSAPRSPARTGPPCAGPIPPPVRLADGTDEVWWVCEDHTGGEQGPADRGRRRTAHRALYRRRAPGRLGRRGPVGDSSGHPGVPFRRPSAAQPRRLPDRVDQLGAPEDAVGRHRAPRRPAAGRQRRGGPDRRSATPRSPCCSPNGSTTSACSRSPTRRAGGIPGCGRPTTAPSRSSSSTRSSPGRCGRSARPGSRCSMPTRFWCVTDAPRTASGSCGSAPATCSPWTARSPRSPACSCARTACWCSPAPR